jgi:hypothetical protein
MKFCSESIFSMIFSVSPIASAFPTTTIISIDANPTNGLSSIFETSVAKHLLVFVFLGESF